ncbi:MAG TPA: LysM domain-containing protein [Gaiellaceae bacterium]|jgi:LysM repeat protein|nr:LysM domain-containing protein [Gaiellaceae bacterium]
MDPRRRRELTRYGAPAAFLAAVTIAVILIKAGLNSGSGSTTTVGLPPTTAATTTRPTTTKLVLTTPQSTTATTTETTTPGAEYYVVQSGDTLGSIAQKYSATVDELMTLNPGIDPTALRIGQRIRTK